MSKEVRSGNPKTVKRGAQRYDSIAKSLLGEIGEYGPGIAGIDLDLRPIGLGGRMLTEVGGVLSPDGEQED